MSKRIFILMGAVALFAGGPASAGDGTKCTAGTQECLNMMASNLRDKGLVGVEGEWDPEAGVYRISSFIDGSHAEAAGIRPGDELQAVNGIALSEQEATYADRENRKPGATVPVTVVRNGKPRQISVRLIGMSDDMIAQYVGAHMLDHAQVAMARAD